MLISQYLSDLHREVIDWAVSSKCDVNVTLAGSCALAGFYSSVREPGDVDFYVDSVEEIGRFLQTLSRSFSILNQRKETERSHYFDIQVGDIPVSVHCIYLRYWGDIETRRIYSKLNGQIRVVDPRFIGIWKLSWYKGDDQRKLAKMLLDLFSLEIWGCNAEEVLDAFLKIRGSDQLNPYPYAFPNVPKKFLMSLAPNICWQDFEKFQEHYPLKIKHAFSV